MPKLTLRDLFWLLLVLALAAGWLFDRTILAGRLAIVENDLKMVKLGVPPDYVD